MANADRSGALDGLRVLKASDQPRYKRALEAGQQLGWGYYLPFLLSRHRSGRRNVLIAEDEASVCLYRWQRRDDRERLDLFAAPVPMDAGVLARALERANTFNGDLSARVLRIDEKDAELASTVAALELRERKAQYIYAPEAFADIAGRRYRTLRRNVKLVEQMPGVEVLPFTADHAESCQSLLARWGARHRETHGGSGGAASSRRALEICLGFGEPDVLGEVILIDGQLVAFALGGEIRPGVACFFEAKSTSEVPGLAYFQRYSFLSKLTRFALINDGSDAGRPGLRQLKDSLRPVAMHKEYRGTQARRRGGAS